MMHTGQQREVYRETERNYVCRKDYTGTFIGKCYKELTINGKLENGGRNSAGQETIRQRDHSTHQLNIEGGSNAPLVWKRNGDGGGSGGHNREWLEVWVVTGIEKSRNIYHVGKEINKEVKLTNGWGNPFQEV